LNHNVIFYTVILCYSLQYKENSYTYICKEEIRRDLIGNQFKVPWLPNYRISTPQLPLNVDLQKVLPLYVELNMDDFKMTRTVNNTPTSCNLVFKGIPFEEQEKMKNVFLIGIVCFIVLYNTI